jgi:hypothetical protein
MPQPRGRTLRVRSHASSLSAGGLIADGNRQPADHRSDHDEWHCQHAEQQHRVHVGSQPQLVVRSRSTASQHRKYVQHDAPHAQRIMAGASR